MRPTIIARAVFGAGAALLAAAAFVAGCSSDPTIDPLDPDASGTSETGVRADGSLPDAVMTDAADVSSMTVAVGAAGGTVTVKGLVLSVPAGALTTEKSITVTATSDAAPAGFTLYSPIYKFEPEGLVFDKPVTIEIAFTSGSPDPSLFWSQASGTGYDDVNGTLVGSSLRGSVTHFSKGFVGKLNGDASAVIDASADGANDAQAPTDSGTDASVTDSGANDATVLDSGTDAAAPSDAGQDSAIADAAADGPASCVAYPATAPLVSLVNIAAAMPAFTGGTIVDGIYELNQVITYTGVGGATGTSTGSYTQTQRFTSTIWEGLITIPSSSFTGSFSATYTAVGPALTFTKSCGNLNAVGSNYTAVGDQILLQSGGSSVQVLQRKL